MFILVQLSEMHGAGGFKIFLQYSVNIQCLGKGYKGTVV